LIELSLHQNEGAYKLFCVVAYVAPFFLWHGKDTWPFELNQALIIQSHEKFSSPMVNVRILLVSVDRWIDKYRMNTYRYKILTRSQNK